MASLFLKRYARIWFSCYSTWQSVGDCQKCAYIAYCKMLAKHAFNLGILVFQSFKFPFKRHLVVEVSAAYYETRARQSKTRLKRAWHQLMLFCNFSTKFLWPNAFQSPITQPVMPKFSLRGKHFGKLVFYSNSMVSLKTIAISLGVNLIWSHPSLSAKETARKDMTRQSVCA